MLKRIGEVVPADTGAKEINDLIADPAFIQ
jgi:hypothetical protein